MKDDKLLAELLGDTQFSYSTVIPEQQPVLRIAYNGRASSDSWV
ncbi:MAG: hypothetical protein ACI814_000365 [Mariniblastus sp.]|jgi:hypothetical protein